MKQLLNAAFGFVPNPLFFHFVENNGIQTFEGLRSIGFSVQHTKYFFNSSFHKDTDFGGYVNGSYTHLFRKLQKMEIDTIFNPFPYSVKNNAYTYTEATSEYNHVIISVTKKKIRTDILDVITSIDVFDLNVWLLLFVSILLYWVLMYTQNMVIRFIDTLAALTRQHFVKYGKRNIRRVSFLLHISFALIYVMIAVSFSTNLSVHHLPKKVENLYDIIEQNAIPLFYEHYGTHVYFENSIKNIYSMIWKIKKKQVLKMTELQKTKDSLDDLKNGKIVILGPNYLLNTFSIGLCEHLDHNVEELYKDHQFYYMSKPFISTVMAYPIRNRLSYEMRKQFQLYIYTRIENGFHEFYYNRYTREVVKIAFQCSKPFSVCEAKLKQHSIYKEADNFSSIKLYNITITIILLKAMFIYAVIAFNCEQIYHSIQRRKKCRKFNQLMIRIQNLINIFK